MLCYCYCYCDYSVLLLLLLTVCACPFASQFSDTRCGTVQYRTVQSTEQSGGVGTVFKHHLMWAAAQYVHSVCMYIVYVQCTATTLTNSACWLCLTYCTVLHFMVLYLSTFLPVRNELAVAGQ